LAISVSVLWSVALIYLGTPAAIEEMTVQLREVDLAEDRGAGDREDGFLPIKIPFSAKNKNAPSPGRSKVAL
jgi:hypothetical protein